MNFEDIPVIRCPHLPPNVVILTTQPIVCPFCEEDAVKEAERIRDEGQ